MINELKLLWKFHNHKILMIGGAICVGGGVISGIVAGTRLEKIIDKHQKKKEELKAAAADDSPEMMEIKKEMGWTDENGDRWLKTALAKETVTEVGEVVLNFALPIGLTFGGLAFMFMGFNILSMKYLTSVSVANSLSATLSAYRKRWQEKVGVEEERKVWYDIKEEKHTILDEDGNVIGEEVVASTGEIPGPYSFIFDSTSGFWNESGRANYNFLMGCQEDFNKRLKANGFVFLNEVLEQLDLPKTQAGQMVGWDNSRSAGGDRVIDFGIFQLNSEANRRFINGYEPNVLLNFNCDGIIIDHPDIWGKHYTQIQSGKLHAPRLSAI